jgi:hypothetical protein
MTMIVTTPANVKPAPAPAINLDRFAIMAAVVISPDVYIPWSERPKLTDAERAEVNAIRNSALWDAEHDPGLDGAGLTTKEISDWVRAAEARAIADVFAAREAAEVSGPCPTFDGDIYHPTAEDWADYAAHLEELDAREELMAQWHAEDQCSEFERVMGPTFATIDYAELRAAGIYWTPNGYVR